MIARFPAVTLALLAISVLLSLQTDFGQNQSALLPFLFANPANPADAGLSDILNGQLWRLLTPMFLHFSMMHLLFNMMALWDLGRLLERRLGPTAYLGLVLVTALLSNLFQYLVTSSPLFGGMSGVLYGLFAYIWIRGKYDTGFADDLAQPTVLMMLVWFGLCWTGLLGPIANWAHTAGLLVGAVWGYLGARRNPAVATAGAQPATARKSLQYLSTADMLELETHRRWARELCPAEQYERIDGKLALIEQVLNRSGAAALPEQQMLSLEVAFGDALIQSTGAIWATMSDRFGRTPVLLLPHNPSVIFPAQTLRNWLAAGREGNIAMLFQSAVLAMQKRAGPAS